MSKRTLRNCRILVVEDEYLLAEELRGDLGDVGAIVIGPVGTVTDGLTRARSEAVVDGAVLDLNLRGEMAFPIADLLVERRVPFVFVTGYDAVAIPKRFAHIARCEKPIDLVSVTRAIGREIGSA